MWSERARACGLLAVAGRAQRVVTRGCAAVARIRQQAAGSSGERTCSGEHVEREQQQLAFLLFSCGQNALQKCSSFGSVSACPPAARAAACSSINSSWVPLGACERVEASGRWRSQSGGVESKVRAADARRQAAHRVMASQERAGGEESEPSARTIGCAVLRVSPPSRSTRVVGLVDPYPPGK